MVRKTEECELSGKHETQMNASGRVEGGLCWQVEK